MLLSKFLAIVGGVIALGLFIWLIIYLASWSTVYGPEQTAHGIVSDKYHRSSFSTYIPGYKCKGGHTTYHPAVWRVTIKCSELNTEFYLSGRSNYDSVSSNQALTLIVKPSWRVRMKDGKEIARKWNGYVLVSYHD